MLQHTSTVQTTSISQELLVSKQILTTSQQTRPQLFFTSANFNPPLNVLTYPYTNEISMFPLFSIHQTETGHQPCFYNELTVDIRFIADEMIIYQDTIFSQR